MSKCAICDKTNFDKNDLVLYAEKCDTGICYDCNLDLEHPRCHSCGGREGLECQCPQHYIL